MPIRKFPRVAPTTAIATMIAGLTLAGCGNTSMQSASPPLQSVSLDGGALTVAPGPAPTMSQSTALSLYHASEPAFAGQERAHVTEQRFYHGLVSVRPDVTPGVQHLPGWVVVYKVAGVASCPALPAPSSPSPSPTYGYTPSGSYAFVVADDHSVALTYAGTGTGACGPSARPAASNAIEQRSVAWTIVSSTASKKTLRYQMPPCGTFQQSSVEWSTKPPHGDEALVVVTVPIAATDCGPARPATTTVDLAGSGLGHGPTGTYGVDPGLRSNNPYGGATIR